MSSMSGSHCTNMSGPDLGTERPVGAGACSEVRQRSWRRQLGWQHAGVLLLYALLTLAMTWPLVLHLGTGVLGPPGDNLEYVWKLWWFKEALWERGVSPLSHPGVFYPFGYPLALGETTMVHTVLGLPLTLVLGEVAAYNVMMCLSFVLSGYGLFVLLRELDCLPAAAIIGGAIFAFAPYRLAHLGAGHLPLMGTGWVPLTFWALERLLKRASWRYALLAGFFFALLALSSWYYALMAAPFVLLYVLLRVRPWRTLFRPALLAKLAGAALVALIVVAPAALPTLRLAARDQLGHGASFKYIDLWSASPTDFFLPGGMHSLWGAAVTKSLPQNIQEHQLYLGAVALVLAGIGLIIRRTRRLTWVYALLGAVGFVLALGTTLHVKGDPLYVAVSPAIDGVFTRLMDTLTSRWALNKLDYGSLRLANAIVIPMPTLLLYLFVPLMGAMRVWARFGLVTLLAVAVLAGWGADWLLRRVAPVGSAPGMYAIPDVRHPWPTLCAALLGLLVLFDFAVLPYPYGWTEVRGQPVDQWLAEQPAGTPIIHFPLAKTWYGWMLYPTRVHGQPIAYGYGTFAPREYREAQVILDTWPSEAALDLLRKWGVVYALVGERSFGNRWPAVREATAALDGVQPVAVFDDASLYHEGRLTHLVRPSPEVPVTALMNGDRRSFLEDRIHVYAIR